MAVVSSFPRLGSRVLWLDEAYTIGATNQLFETWRHTAATQALYYLLVWPFSRISTDPGWLRLPSAVLGAAAVVVVFHAGRRIGGRREATVAAGGLALSWGFARYSIEARSYTLALLLVAITWLALIAIVQAGDEPAVKARRWWLVFTVATLLLPFVHGLATLNFVAQLAALAVVPESRRSLLRRALVVVPGLGLEVALLFLLGASDVGDWVPPLSWGQLLGFKQLLLGFGRAGQLLAALTAVAAVWTIASFVRDRSRETWLRMLPVFWALGPPILIVGMSLVRPYAAPRYVLASLPAFFLLAAGLVARLGSTKLVAAACVVIALPMLSEHRHVTTNGIENWAGVTSCIAANAVDGDRLVTAAAHRPPLDYYWPGYPELAAVEAYAPPEPLGDVRRLYTSFDDTGQRLIPALLEDTSRPIWFLDRGTLGRATIATLAFDTQIRAEYKLSKPQYFRGDLTLVRLDPLDTGQPRSEAACDTIPTPTGSKAESHL